MLESEIYSHLTNWSADELDEFAVRVWAAVEYRGRGREALVSAMVEILR